MFSAKKLFISVGVVIGGLVLIVLAAVGLFFYGMFSTVMTKQSPDGRHWAKLTRVDGIDLIFKVTVDGQQVYQSPDFAPTSADCREQIIWSSDSQAVVILVAEQRLFGYHVKENRPLTDAELFRVAFPQITDLGFEGTLPTAPAAER